MPLVLGLALGANLVPLFALILVARPTNREAAYTTGNKEITIRCGPHSVTTDLTHLATWMLRRFLYRSARQTQTVTKLDNLIKTRVRKDYLRRSNPGHYRIKIK